MPMQDPPTGETTTHGHLHAAQIETPAKGGSHLVLRRGPAILATLEKCPEVRRATTPPRLCKQRANKRGFKIPRQPAALATAQRPRRLRFARGALHHELRSGPASRRSAIRDGPPTA